MVVAKQHKSRTPAVVPADGVFTDRKHGYKTRLVKRILATDPTLGPAEVLKIAKDHGVKMSVAVFYSVKNDMKKAESNKSTSKMDNTIRDVMTALLSARELVKVCGSAENAKSVIDSLVQITG